MWFQIQPSILVPSILQKVFLYTVVSIWSGPEPYIQVKNEFFEQYLFLS